jgi:uncharacterized protein YecT (DUF1311 family)
MSRIPLFRMIVLMSLAILLIPLICVAQQKKKPKSCWDTAMSQSEMNQCAGSELKAAQTKLAAVLKKLGVSPDAPAQKAWESYRDAQLETIYPKEQIGEFGSVTPMCFAILETHLTNGRIRDLNALITFEGDVCQGLRRVAERRSNKFFATPVNLSTTEIHRKDRGGCSMPRDRN